ncbi:MAG: hypothetical protein ACRDI2_14870, partial [Chloroflexota bacterium]
VRRRKSRLGCGSGNGEAELGEAEREGRPDPARPAGSNLVKRGGLGGWLSFDITPVTGRDRRRP